MLDFQRIQRLHGRAVQVFVNYRHLIGYRPIIHGGNDVAHGISCSEAHGLPNGLSSGNRTPYHLISQYISLRNGLGAEVEIDPVGCHLCSCHAVTYSFYLTFRIQYTASAALQPIYSGFIIDIVNGSGLLGELTCISSGPLVRRHSPTLEEVQNILFGRRAG